MNITVVDHRGSEFSTSAQVLADAVKNSAFVAFYDAAAVEPDNEVRPLDWAVSTLLQAPIRRYAPLKDLFESDFQKWTACNQALQGLGPDVPLESEDAVGRRQNVKACFKAFMAPSGIGPSIAAKTLHKKRPQLIPVVDDFVCTVLTGRRGVSLGYSTITDVVFDSFRPQLLSNRDALRETSKLLGDESALSSARLLDIAIWMHADGNKADYGL